MARGRRGRGGGWRGGWRGGRSTTTTSGSRGRRSSSWSQAWCGDHQLTGRSLSVSDAAGIHNTPGGARSGEEEGFPLTGEARSQLSTEHAAEWRARILSFFKETRAGRACTVGAVVESAKERRAREAELGRISAEVHVGVEVDCQDVSDWDPALCAACLESPDEMLGMFDEALVEAQEALLKSAAARSHPEWRVARKAHARLCHVPPFLRNCKPNVSSIRCEDVGPLIQVSGTACRVGGARVLEIATTFECLECGARFAKRAEREQAYVTPKPKGCVNFHEGCVSRRFAEFDVEATDYREVTLQEHADQLETGRIPRSLVVCCEDDLAGAVNAGDAVVVVGRLLLRWEPLVVGQRVETEIVMLANSIRRVGADAARKGGEGAPRPEDIKVFDQHWKGKNSSLAARDHVVHSVCPQLYGASTAKLALLLAVVGGVSSADARDFKRRAAREAYVQGSFSSEVDRSAEGGLLQNGGDGEEIEEAWLRGTPHVLFVGDPGMGKSELLRFAERVSPRAVATNATSTSAAGLTCAAVKNDQGLWEIEAGALPLADGGCCLIDEFGHMKKADRNVMLEAMEQQTISFAKAGLVGQLPTRCAVVAACNPVKGVYDKTLDLAANTGLETPLLSRFDVVLVVLDQRDYDWDKAAATAVLNAHLAPGEDPLAVDSDDDDEVVLVEHLQDRFREASCGFVSSADAEAAVELPSDAICKPDLGLKPFVVRVKEKAGSSRLDDRDGGRENYPEQTRMKSFRKNPSPDDWWDVPLLRKYVIHVRATYCPTIGHTASQLLTAYYSRQRARVGHASGRATVRMLESLIRLAQAHARIMRKSQADLQDAVIACLLVDKSMGPTEAAFDAGLDVIPEPIDGVQSDVYFEYQQACVFETLNFVPDSQQHSIPPPPPPPPPHF